ncbi:MULTISPECIES: ExeM/NucH family extracellular endonuclease [Deinococcus]|uniref:ExeM/NucH family extracellular endonuclease n=1 Tax=Deinococcus rufus TaxID=2136097 RepID=A0ABV7ZD85_9DEIO|nr:ExeM/NucH family extracellular endonuclease [Deinococcus sp. AB2017081]WQE97000.1 ExeM/NucH family extracellular endonuclease [Deinococcus sp. AB2017081]
MRPSLLVVLSCTLLVAACGSTPATQTTQTPDMIAQANKVAVLSVAVAPEVKYVQAVLTPKKGGTAQTLTAAPADGTAIFQVSGVSAAEYVAVVSAYDDADRAVMLYDGTGTVALKAGRATAFPALNRVTATVIVNATPTLEVTATYSATLGSATQPMTVTDGVARTTFATVPTARGLTVTVTGTTADGQTSQSGSATFNLTKGGSTVPVTLAAQAICAAAILTPISAVQGSGAASPLAGQSVTVRGTVTADYQNGLSGFMLQDAGDGNDATSDGVFVYTGTTPQTVAVGDTVQLTANVKEFGTAPNTLTELDAVTGFSKCGTALVVKPVQISAPFNDLERFEGMLVTYPGTLTITDNFPYGRYGELGLSATGRQFNPTNGNSATLPGTAELLANRIVLDDGRANQNPNPLAYVSGANTRRTGDTVTGLTGTLHYANGAFKVEPVGTVPFVEANPQPAAPKAVGGTLTVAGANVLNYFTTFGGANDRGANSALEFQRQKTKVVNALKGLDADIVTLMEVQNNGDTALNDLVAGLNTAYGSETYRAIQTGVIGTDAIKVAIIYKPARVTPFGSYVTDTNSVYSRPPLAQTFQKTGGGTLTVIANHFKSKGSCPSSGDVDTGQGCWNQLRVQQAQAVTAFAERLKARVNDQDVLIMGDLNSYGAEDPITAIVGAGYESLNTRIPAEDRYSYQFGGLFGYLDHALSSSALSAQVTGITEWHINSDEPTVADYNVEFKATAGCTTSCNGADLYNPATPFRASDHDPVLVGLNLAPDSPTDPTEPLGVTATGSSAATTNQPYTLNVTTTGTPDSVTVNWGDGTTGPVTASPVTHTYTTTGSFTITVTATRGAQTQTATQAVTVSAAPTGVGRLVISQVYGGGGNSGAPYRNDFIELFNAGSAPVNLGGYSVQYNSAAGTSAYQVTPLTAVTLNPGQYYLVQQAAGASTTAAPLPTPDATGTITMGGTAGKVALVNGTAALAATDTPSSTASIVDFVGFGTTATTYEGTAPAPAPSNTTADLRAGNGCTDTNQNAADFATGAPAPRTTASALNVCAP